jgi:hypothetical protein
MRPVTSKPKGVARLGSPPGFVGAITWLLVGVRSLAPRGRRGGAEGHLDLLRGCGSELTASATSLSR